MRRRSSIEQANRDQSDEIDSFQWVEQIDKNEVWDCLHFIEFPHANSFVATIPL